MRYNKESVFRMVRPLDDPIFEILSYQYPGGDVHRLIFCPVFQARIPSIVEEYVEARDLADVTSDIILCDDRLNRVTNVWTTSYAELRKAVVAGIPELMIWYTR